MVVISLTNCPPGLRGDLTLWLQEISVGVYAGEVNARVREELWKRIVENAGKGCAVLVYAAANEQGMSFRVHQTGWYPIDYDGLKLMFRPRREEAPGAQKALTPGFSRQAVYQTVKRVDNAKQKRAGSHPEEYVVVDLETTGLSAQSDEIFELGALRVNGGAVVGRYQTLVCTQKALPAEVVRLTGVTNDMLRNEGRKLEAVLPEFLDFVGEMPMVCHNAPFDCEFIRVSCARLGLASPRNRAICTLKMARILIDDVEDYRLSTLSEYFSFPECNAHRSLNDCETTMKLYMKLIEIQQ